MQYVSKAYCMDVQKRKEQSSLPVIKPRSKEPEPVDIWNTRLPLGATWGIYARQSTPAQLVKNTQSTEMQTDDLIKWIEERNLSARKICLFDADLGVSGTLRIDQRTGLQELVAGIEADEIKIVLVYQISRLFRDETGVQYNVFATKCREHNCLLVTADGMVFNFNNPMHLKMFRYLAEIAAEFIPQHIGLLHQARLRKARQGFWAGQGTIASGYIVDYARESPTFGKLIPYRGHRHIIFALFKRYYELGGNFYAVYREFDELPYVFPDFEAWVDKRNVNHWKKRIKVPGGYKLTRYGLLSILTNPVYIGWWIVGGDIISRTNHEPLIDQEHEYLFWYAFDRLAPYNADGEINEKRVTQQPRRFYQRRTDDASCAAGLLKDRIIAGGAEVYTHNDNGRANYIICYAEAQGRVTRTGNSHIHAAPIDAAFTNRFFEHLEEIHDLDEYRRYIAEETQKQEAQSSFISTQLLEIDSQQDAIVEEITATRRAVKQQILREQAENALLDTEKRQQELELEAKPLLDKLRSRFSTLEALKKELQGKLDQLPQESQELRQARQFASFHVELRRLRLVWDRKPFPVRKEFVNLFVEKATISVASSHWVRLDVAWSYPAWGTDVLYVYRRSGVNEGWTEEEKALVREHYFTADQVTFLQLLPTKTFRAIKQMAHRMGLPAHPRTRLAVSEFITWEDWLFMQRVGIERGQTTKCVALS
jgi:hypothetical protein